MSGVIGGPCIAISAFLHCVWSAAAAAG